jgi:hypothetical protein
MNQKCLWSRFIDLAHELAASLLTRYMAVRFSDLSDQIILDNVVEMPWRTSFVSIISYISSQIHQSLSHQPRLAA